MSKMNFIMFVAGVATGGVSSWIFASRYFGRLCDETIDDEVREIREYYDAKYDNAIKEISNKEDTEKEVVEEPVKKKPGRPKKVKQQVETEPDYEEVIDKLNYNRYSETSKSNKKPYVITLDEYNEDRSQDKKIVSYFPDDDIVMDSDTEQVIDNVGTELGFDNLETMGISDDTNEIYIRNERTGVDYQVVLESGSYEDFLDSDY